ncbi:MAG: alpha/beta fold hydrolase [Bacteriovoracaceae bacterium]|nr:alpha/beta fold hydrolase [Bacteriovoracaceae bacterium]
MPNSNSESGTFLTSKNGHQVYFKKTFFAKEGQKKTLNLYFFHGALEHHGRHEIFFNELAKIYDGNLRMIFIDFQGHGLSAGPRAYVENLNIYCEDVLTLMREQKDLDGVNVCMGHSMGGLILLKTMIDYPSNIPIKIQGSLFSNPPILPKIKIPLPLETLLKKMKGVVTKIRIPNIYKGYDLTSLESRANDFDSDPLINKFFTLGLAKEIKLNCEKIKGLAYLVDTPCLFLLSENDVIVDSKATQKFVTGINPSLAQECVYPHAKHDLLNEADSAKVREDIVVWLKSIGC